MKFNPRGLVLIVVCILVLVGLAQVAKAQSSGIQPLLIPKSAIKKDVQPPAATGNRIFWTQDGIRFTRLPWQLQMVVRTAGSVQLINLRGYPSGDLCHYHLSSYRPTTYDDTMIYFQCVAPDPKHPYE